MRKLIFLLCAVLSTTSASTQSDTQYDVVIYCGTAAVQDVDTAALAAKLHGQRAVKEWMRPPAK